MKKKFLYAEDFAKAKFTDIFPREDLDKADVFTANYFSNAILMNEGNLKFDVVAMPWQAQLIFLSRRSGGGCKPRQPAGYSAGRKLL